MVAAQIQIARGGLIQTLAAVQTARGVIILSTFGAAGSVADAEIVIPNEARAWLAAVMGGRA